MRIELGWSLQLLLWASMTSALCCRSRWFSLQLGRAATRMVTEKMNVALTLLPHRNMMFQDFEAKTQHRVGALETTGDGAVDHGLPPECARLRGIVFRAHLSAFRQPLGDPPT